MIKAPNAITCLVRCLVFCSPLLLAACQSIADWVYVRPAKREVAQAAVLPLSLIPQPAKLERSAGTFTFAGDATVGCEQQTPDCASVASYLAGLAGRTTAVHLTAASAPGAAIVLREDRTHAAEGYTLDVSEHGVTITASDRAGWFYGSVTLWQLLTQGAGAPQSLPFVHIEDAPRFAWRGVLLDSVRHFQSPEFVKAFIDEMALHKLNVLQWHLTDDQGWRLEIRKYPKLTSVAAWRVPAGAAPAADIDPATGKPRLYGGYYTQDQIREIVAYAQARCVTIVPEIEMPGHAQAAIVAYPNLGSVDHPPASVSSDWGVFPYLYNTDDTTFTFLENVLTETMALFPSPYIHIGGDEAVKNQWKASKKIQTKMKKLGITNEDQLQSWFMARIGAFLEVHGRRMIGWDEILQGGVPPNATITSWRGIDGAVTAAKLGHDTVLSPDPTLYLDNRQIEGASEPPGRGGIVSLKDVYEFNPAPAQLSDAERKHIIGVQANIWTEHIRTEDRVAYAAFPRLAALAEVGWSPAATHDWTNFVARLPAQLGRYRALQTPHSEGAFAVRAIAQPGKDAGHLVAALADQTGFGEIRYTLDGSAPAVSSAIYTAPIRAKTGATINASAFAGAQELTAPANIALTSESLLTRDSHELTLCGKAIPLSLEDDAPLTGPRAVFLVDIMHPCWIWPKVDMNRLTSIEADVGNLPFNFQIGDDINKVELFAPRTPDGEFEAHLDTCAGPVVASLSLTPAIHNQAVTTLKGSLTASPGIHDLCFLFTHKSVDPIWAVKSIRLGPVQ